MSNNQIESEQVADTAKKWGIKLLRNKFIIILLIIILTIIFLVAFLKVILKYDTADKSSKINGLYNEKMYIEYKIC